MIRLSERLHKPAPDARTACPEVPASIARIIGRCLERSAAARYQSVAEILADLTAGRARGKQWGFRRLERRTVSLAIVAAVISGAEPIISWERIGPGLYRAPWPEPLPPSVVPAEWPGWLNIGKPALHREMLFSDHRRLESVILQTQRSEASPFPTATITAAS